MTHHPNQQTPEADRCRGVDRSLLEFLKPKAEERYSKLEAYCDLLSKASSGAYQSPGTDGALQLLPGQFVATISELARQWQWQLSLFLSRVRTTSSISAPCSSSASSKVDPPPGKWPIPTADYDLKMNMAKQEGYGGIPARRVLNQQAQMFDSLAVSIFRYLNQEKELPEELSDSVSLLFGKDHVWDWHKVIDSLGISPRPLTEAREPSEEVAPAESSDD